MLWEILKASKGILVADFYDDLWANLAGGGTPVDVFVEMIGSLPLYYNGKGYDLTDYIISGNAVQDGTPSADAPVDAVGSGVRTENLFDYKSVYAGYIDSNDDISTTANKLTSWNYFTTDDIGKTITVSIYVGGISSSYIRVQGLIDGEYITGNAINGGSVGYTEITVTPNSTSDRWRITYGTGTPNVVLNQVMVAVSATRKDYEPYGYKLPLTVNGVEYPIYLGRVETTRRIKKLVLTGEESWFEFGAENPSRFITYAISDRRRHIAPLCTHYIGSTVTNYSGLSNGYISVNTTPSNNNRPRAAIHDDRFLTVAAFKSYLAAQYQNGTPVTVWYVLAEPETAVVNEPLMKIGDYADTVSAAQAGVTIPTVNGANVLDMASLVKPSEVYIKGKGIKPTGYGQLADVNSVNILDKDGRPIYVHGQ